MALIIFWQVFQGYLSTQNLAAEFSSELSSGFSKELTIDATYLNNTNSTVHIAYWSSPSILFGVDQPFGRDDLLKLVGVFLLFATPYYFLRNYIHKLKIVRNT